jgi:hypothetical protein
MILKPQDIVVLLKLAAHPEVRWTYPRLGQALAMSASEVHAAIRRAHQARLATEASAGARPVRAALAELLVHGVKYVFPPERGELTRGVPTGYAAPPLNRSINLPNEPPPVWPYSEGDTRGYAFAPLYKSVPVAALGDRALYELLALVDAIRDGRAREREIAAKELKARLDAG